jgi:mono/diheme cytochrome c family protein
MCARRTRLFFVTVLVQMATLAACGGGDGTADTTTADTGTGAVTPVDTGGGATGEITPQLIALGDSIFKGQAAGGICFTCHGPDAKGTTLAPDLTDTTWLNGDGSRAFIASTVRQGIATPKQYPAPMPPFGQMLNDQQVNAVSAYVYSLTHPR